MIAARIGTNAHLNVRLERAVGLAFGRVCARLHARADRLAVDVAALVGRLPTRQPSVGGPNCFGRCVTNKQNAKNK
jgi:hypothetical protein